MKPIKRFSESLIEKENDVNHTTNHKEIKTNSDSCCKCYKLLEYIQMWKKKTFNEIGDNLGLPKWET